ncbi:MAG: S8 family peptidase [Candidatus Krumholzibacteria bacterium]|nr:S8 family peptidase [Candidatus Krumholzibacteria bacterium]
MKRLFALSLAAAFLLSSACFASGSNHKFNTSLRFMLEHRQDPGRMLKIYGPVRAAASSERAVLTVKFDHVLSGSEIEQYRSMGAEFYHFGGEVARTGSIYPVQVPWESIDRIAGRTEVLRLEGTWHPAVYPVLDVSGTEIEADTAHLYTDGLGFPITGKGMRIADFDTGIDVFHPSFFFSDGDTVDWIDKDGDGAFNPGWDCVDLNNNGQPGQNELLDYYDGWIYDPAATWAGSNPANVGNGYQTYWDWLYNDANDNGVRDYGPASGYHESDPTFGELIFVPLDENGNGNLDVGEKLVTLGTSKIYATMNSGEIERLRGVDIIDSDDDTNGHGTAVSGILAGGTPHRHIFDGVAPDAEILMGYFFSSVPISVLVPWARSHDADAMLYEFGGFVYRYLDGSSLDEELISTENSSIIQITPSGNLGRGDKHAIATVPAGGSVTLQIQALAYGGSSIMTLWGTTLWRTNPEDLTFHLKDPLGGEVILEGTVSYFDGYYLWFEKSTSPRGTCALDIYVDHDTNPSCNGIWELTVDNNTGADIEVISNIADDQSSWAGGAEFVNYATDQRNVTFPATADSSFTNGSYSTRGYEGYGGVGGGSIPVGEISAFSGRGERIDGHHLLDICSPGNYDVYSTRTHQDGAGYPNGSYRQFSGTSAAGPHVAAAAVLVQQVFPTATMADVMARLRNNAAEDSFTGATYNDTWGYGKLKILGAIGVATGVEEMEMGLRPPKLLLDQNYPNPFNPTTWIPFYLPRSGRMSIKIFNVKGELVKVLEDKWMNEGAHSARWNGDDTESRQVASGLYFCVLRYGNETETRKLVLLR